MVVTTPSLNFLFPSIKYFFHLCTVQCMHITSHGHGTPNQLFFYGQQHPVCQESCFLKFKSMSAKLNISYAPLRHLKLSLCFAWNIVKAHKPISLPPTLCPYILFSIQKPKCVLKISSDNVFLPFKPSVPFPFH